MANIFQYFDTKNNYRDVLQISRYDWNLIDKSNRQSRKQVNEPDDLNHWMRVTVFVPVYFLSSLCFDK